MSIKHNKTTEISHYLGIDYGKADVGLALADSETKMAFACGKLKNDKNLLDNILREIKRKNVIAAVVGLPQHGNINVNINEYRQFGEKLKNKGKIDVNYYNEMFTTKMAQDNLIGKGMKNIKRYDNQEAARIILQEWLDGNEC